MSTIDFLARSPLWSLLGWTVLLSLPLGIVAAAVALLAGGTVQRLAARWQHRLVALLYAVSLMGAVIVSAVPRTPAAPLVIHASTSGAGVTAGLAVPVPPGLADVRDVSSRPAIATAVAVVTSIWLFIAIVMTARLANGLLQIHRIVRRSSAVTDPSIVALLQSLRSRMRLGRSVDLRESADVDTAVTGGWRRPFVLLPAGMPSTSIAADLEPILAHELAHVRRRDFPRAVALALADALTALSPGHRWLSLEAARLREEACDDVVVSLGVEPVRYARALEELGRLSRGLQMNRTVCAANRYLAARVRRLLAGGGSERPTPLVVTAAVVAFCAGAWACGVLAMAAPGLPMPPVGHGVQAVGPTLIPWQEASQGHVRYTYDPEATGPFRIMAVTMDKNGEHISLKVRSVFPKRIVALGIGAEVTSRPFSPLESPMPMRSDVFQVGIEPGATAEVRPRLADGTLRRSGIQVNFYASFARFEDETEWNGRPPAPFVLTIPRALVSAAAPRPPSPAENISICFDAEGKQTSQGGIASVREDSREWVRCTNGRWVPTKLPVPEGVKVAPLPPR